MKWDASSTTRKEWPTDESLKKADSNTGHVEDFFSPIDDITRGDFAFPMASTSMGVPKFANPTLTLREKGRAVDRPRLLSNRERRRSVKDRLLL